MHTMLKSTAVLTVCVLLTACQFSSPHQASSHSSGNSGSTMATNQSSDRARFSSTGLLNSITRKDFQVKQNINYGQDIRQKLDVYTPINIQAVNTAKPVIIFVHGGAWKDGSKDDYLFVGESLTKAGYVTVVISHRLAPQYKYPDYVRDTALAIKWTRDNIAQYGGNPDKMVVMGHSSGAFNVVEAVDNSRWLQEVNVPVSAIKAVVGIAGPYSYDFRTDDTKTAFPANATPEQVMPVYHIRKDAPPHLLLYGSSDRRVKPKNTQDLLQALHQQQIPATLEIIDGAGHVSIMAAIATRLSWYKPTRQVILDYLNKTLAK